MMVEMVEKGKKVPEGHSGNCGYPPLTPIPIESDGHNNNPLYWYRDRNPFQPAPQSTYTRTKILATEKTIIGSMQKTSFVVSVLITANAHII